MNRLNMGEITAVAEVLRRFIKVGQSSIG